jgi:hypothetical protein
VKTKRVFSMLPILAVALSGCVTSEFYVKQGVTLDRYQRDTVGCATSATQAVPTNTQVSWAPYVGIYSVDTNEGLRGQNLEICMRDRGYQKVAIPYCAGDALASATESSKTPQDRNRKMIISQSSCYVFDAAGNPYLFTP